MVGVKKNGPQGTTPGAKTQPNRMSNRVTQTVGTRIYEGGEAIRNLRI